VVAPAPGPTAPLRARDWPVEPFVDASPSRGDPLALRRLACDLGYVFLPGLISVEAVASVRAFVRARALANGWVEPADGNPPSLRARRGARLEGRGWDDPRWVELQRLLRLEETFHALAGWPPLTQILDALCGEPARLATTNYCWLKLPGSPEQTTRPHQDCYYLPDHPHLWTAWLPLVETPFDVGPLAVAPGSHREGDWRHVDRWTGIDMPAGTCWHSQEVGPGDLVLFGARTIHCAWSNVSPSLVRASFDLRYEPLSATSTSSLHAGI